MQQLSNTRPHTLVCSTRKNFIRGVIETTLTAFHSADRRAQGEVTHPFVRPEGTHPSAPTRTITAPPQRSLTQGRQPAKRGTEPQGPVRGTRMGGRRSALS